MDNAPMHTPDPRVAALVKAARAYLKGADAGFVDLKTNNAFRDALAAMKVRP